MDSWPALVAREIHANATEALLADEYCDELDRHALAR